MLLSATILVPIIAGTAISVRVKETHLRNRMYVLTMLVTDLLGIVTIAAGGGITLITLTDDVKLTFDVDSLGRYSLAAVMILYTATIIYSFEYTKMEEHVNTFFAFIFISFGALLAVCLSGNLVTLYLCFELATLTTVPLVLHELTKAAVSAGLKYLFYSIAGALMGLLAVFFVYFYAGNDGTFVFGGFLDPAKTAGNEHILLIAVMVGIIGFGTKGGMYPMHGWLPTAHPIAPAPGSALLSAIVAKAGVIAIIRLIYYSVGADFLRGTWVQYTWMCLAMLTVFMGSMMAYREKVIKKRFAYSTISQISYIFLGLSFLSETGLEGGLLHLMSHMAAKGTLFLTAGVFIYKLGYHHVEELKGIGRKMPVTMWCFTIVSLSLVGIPPLGGFLSKWVLALAAIKSGMGVFSILAPVILLISALLTAGYLLTIVVDAFFPGKEWEEENEGKVQNCEPSALMYGPLIALCAVTLIMGLFGTSILGALGF